MDQKQPSNQMQEEEILHTVEDISKEYDKLLKIVFQYEETLSEQQMSYLEAIKQFQVVQQSIINHALFSSNEQISEINSENLKYLLLPYYVGETFGRINQNRKNNIEYQKLYLNEYLKLMNHYEQLSKDAKQIWKNLEENPNYEMTRDVKIAQFKERKVLEAKIKNIEKISDDKTRIEIMQAQMQICIFKTLDALRQINMEIQVLQYKEKLQTDKKIQEQYEQEKSQPIPQIKVWHIPKAPKIDMPYMLSDPNVQQETQHLCQTCFLNTQAEIREQMKGKVWQPGTSMPTMTLDQLADYEIEMMKKNEKANKMAAEQAKKEQEEDSDKDEVNEKKTKKAREWENWKDENEKGSGNRMGK